jgi:proline iminopeptidase
MEAIRILHAIDSMVVAGGSWGTLLAIMYAISHPKQTCGLILRGVFDSDTNKCVVYSMFPEIKDELFLLLKLKPNASNRAVMLKTQRLLQTKTRKRLIRTVSKFDQAAYVKTNMEKQTFKEQERFVVLGTHYESNHFFVNKHDIDRNLHKISHIPAILIAGRYDLVTPIEMAYRFSKQMKKCKLWVVEGGHSGSDPMIRDAVTKASNLII